MGNGFGWRRALPGVNHGRLDLRAKRADALSGIAQRCVRNRIDRTSATAGGAREDANGEDNQAQFEEELHAKLRRGDGQNLISRSQIIT